ncbi:ankyrin repeat domain-containing protein, partial [Phenylobacterium sp.]|uniref:ankyrin repeat domain-containing protein n=1 Tax=Phenylobacterium sp. TaxID=1871053 RepID=UPI002EDABB76
LGARRLPEPPAAARPDEVVVTGSFRRAETVDAPVVRTLPPPEQIARPAPPPPPSSQPFGRLAAPPAAPPRASEAAKSQATIEELVVTESRRPSAKERRERALDSLAERLRAAAAAGRIAEMARLLDQGVPVDAPDDDGETALMLSIRADRPAAAALLVRRGASLDHRNDAGESARDLATETGDAELKRALRLER